MIVSLLLGLATLPPQATPDAAATPTPPVKEKRICRSEVPTGSTLPKHTCHTKSEWAQIDAANARNVESTLGARRNSSGN